METTKRYLENVYPTKNSQFLGSMLVSHGVMLEKQLRLYGFTALQLLQSHLAELRIGWKIIHLVG
jgi:hypothetical protein